MSSTLKYITHILGLTIISLTLFWVTQKYIFFNNIFLEINNLQILYFVLPSILSLILCLATILFIKKGSNFFKNFLVILAFIYLFVSVYSSTGKFCEIDKNISLTNFYIQLLIYGLIVFLVIKYIFPKLNKRDFIVISLSSLIIVADFLFFWISFSIFSNLTI